MASIHQVILDGRLSQLNLVINRIGCNINEQDSYGRTPLHLAVLTDQEHNGYRIARLLLQANADINAKDFQQQTPFIYACLLNRSKLIPLFLQTKSIDWFHSDYEGYLILHHAASSSNTSILAEIVHEMKSIGLSIDCKNELGYTPLILAIKSFRFDNAIYLLDHTDASIFASDDEYHFTCLQWAENVGPKSDQWRQNFSIKKPKKYEIDLIRKKNPIDFSSFSLSNNKSIPGNESSYPSKMLLSNHHPLERAILSPRTKDRKSLSAIIPIEKIDLNQAYQQWLELIQRLHDRNKNHQEKLSPRYNERINSNQQVAVLINDYSSILSTDNRLPLISRFMNLPKSIIRPRGPMDKYRFTKVTFALN